MTTTRSYPRVFIKNPENIFLQIIRNNKEFTTFTKIDPERRCLIDDLMNFTLWKEGTAPYNQQNISFGIMSNLYEAFTTGTVLELEHHTLRCMGMAQ